MGIERKEAMGGGEEKKTLVWEDTVERRRRISSKLRRLECNRHGQSSKIVFFVRYGILRNSRNTEFRFFFYSASISKQGVARESYDKSKNQLFF